MRYIKRLLEHTMTEWIFNEYLGNEYYGPMMLGVTSSNQSDEYIKNVEIGSRSGMVYGEALSVEIKNNSPQTVAVLCRDKL